MAILRHEPAIPCSTPTSRTAAGAGSTVRPVLETLPALLPAQSRQPALCPAPSALVCAEPSGRGFRRDLCGMAAAAFELADTLCRLAGAEEARYVDELMDEIAGKRPLVTSRERVDPLHGFSETLRSHYQKNRRLTPSSHRRPTTAISTGCFPPIPPSPGATGFNLREAPPRPRTEAGCALDRRKPAHARCGARRHDHPLPRANSSVGSERKLLTDFTVLLTAKTMHALFGPSRRKWIAYETPARHGADASRFHAPGHDQRVYGTAINVWKTEYDVVSTLRAAGHEVRPLGVQDELKPAATRSKASSRRWCSICWSSFTARSSTTRTSQATSS